MTQIDHLKHFIARRKWEALEAMYNTTRVTIWAGIRNNQRPESIAPNDWEDILHYREEWHKANNELRRLRDEAENCK